MDILAIAVSVDILAIRGSQDQERAGTPAIVASRERVVSAAPVVSLGQAVSLVTQAIVAHLEQAAIRAIVASLAQVV